MRVSRVEENGVTIVEVEGTIKLGESAEMFARELQTVFESTAGGVVIGYLQRFTRANRRVALFRPHQSASPVPTAAWRFFAPTIVWRRCSSSPAWRRSSQSTGNARTRFAMCGATWRLESSRLG